MEECEQKIDNLPDDYLHEIPIFKSNTDAASQAVSRDVEYTIAKATKLIKSKSITKKPKRRRGKITQQYRKLAAKAEYNKWVDDSYILLGKSFYYKHNFLTAYDYFSFVLTTFPKEKTAFEAHIWMMRCDIALDRYAEAEEKFKYLNSDVNFPKKYAADLLLAHASSMLVQERYEEAYSLINETLELKIPKQLRARLHFILGQRAETENRVKEAIEHFEQSEKYAQDYTMKFNAKINVLRLTGGKDLNLLAAELLKMLDKGKNNIYQDQIYFALGNIAMIQEKKDLALDYYKKSAAVSTDNEYQRATSCVKVAEMYFDMDDYDHSFMYYDSAVFVMDETFEDFDKVYAIYQNLDKLVSNMQVVSRQDSLQAMATLSEEELYATIDDLITQQVQEEQRIEQLGNSVNRPRFSPFAQQTNQQLGSSNSNQKYSFYFYNPNTVAYGKTQFQQSWGRRKLEDNWRRKERHGLLSSDEEEEDSSGRETDPKKRAYYLQDIPLNDSLMARSNSKVAKALNEQGQLYTEKFENYEKAVEVYKELIRRFPNSDVELESMFAIYRIGEKTNNAALKTEYRTAILSKYSDTKYAQYLQDPSFMAKHNQRVANIDKLYKQALYHYANSDYSSIPLLVSQIMKDEPESDLVPKLKFLGAVAEGKRGNWMKLQENLTSYTKEYPEGETTVLAKRIIAMMQDSTYTDYERLVALGYINHKIQNKELLGPGEQSNDPYGGKFSYDEDMFHYYVLSFPADTSINEDLLKFDIANYNIDNYPRNDFDIEESWLNTTTKMIVVKPIENKRESLKYFLSIIKERKVFKSLEGKSYLNFVISSSNYERIIEEHSYTDYLKFFAGNYSRFVGTNFTKEELVKEEQKQEEQEKAEEDQERGSYVTVEGNVSSANYTIDLADDNYYVIAISDKTYNTSNLKGVLEKYNKHYSSSTKWRYEVLNFDDYQLFVTKSIKTLPKALTYFRSVISDRSIFGYLSGMSNRNFMISKHNWDILQTNKNIDGYMDFFQSEYLSQVPADAPTAVSETDLSTNPYVDKDGLQYLDIIVPATGFDSDKLVETIKVFNTDKNGDKSLAVSVERLDDLRVIVKIGILKSKAEAMQYLRLMIRENSIRELLMTTTFRNFVITPENDTLFMNRKNITEYMDFYKEKYLKDSQ